MTYWSTGLDAVRWIPRVSPSVRCSGSVAKTPDSVAAHDALIRETSRTHAGAASRGEFASWASSPKRRLALIILYDQVPRNAYRGTAAAYAFDREALALCRRRHAARRGRGARSARAAVLLSTARACRIDGGAGRRDRARSNGWSREAPARSARILRVTARIRAASIARSSRNSGVSRIATRC